MAKVLNTHEQADFERLAAFYPYRDEHGLHAAAAIAISSVLLTARRIRGYAPTGLILITGKRKKSA